MKIAIIGSESMLDKMKQCLFDLTVHGGHEVRLPILDSSGLSGDEISAKNIENIKWCDRVVIFWNTRTQGTVQDFGVIMALGKPLVIGEISEMSIEYNMRRYALRTPELTLESLIKGGSCD